MSKSKHIIRKTVFYIVLFISTLLIFISVLSLLYDTTHWRLKALDFPRLQQLVLGVFFMLLFLLLNREWKIPSFALLAGLIAVSLIQLSFIAPYIIGSKAVPSAVPELIDHKSNVGIMISNVLITNKSADKFLEIIEKTDPDMVLAMETDLWWAKHIKVLENTYMHSIKHPASNGYGMILYSKFPLTDKQTLFLNHSEVPSFHTIVTLPSGKTFKFHGVHPVAPIPSQKYPENVGENNEEGRKEIAIKLVGKLVSNDTIPSIVAGDFNDVSWSNTSRLFGESGNLKDVRIGRGLYNTFNAKSTFMRWPLDHFFVSSEISVVKLQRLDHFDSDHFPLFCILNIN